MDVSALSGASPARSFGFRLWHVHHAFARRVEAALAPLGLTHMQYVMLRAADHLAQAGEQPTQARLAEVIAADRMMVSKVLRLLEGKGLVVRPAHPDDARAHHVVLTAAGLRLVGQAVPAALRAQDAFFGRLGGERAEQLGATLDELLLLEGNPLVCKHIVTATTDPASSHAAPDAPRAALAAAAGGPSVGAASMGVPSGMAAQEHV